VTPLIATTAAAPAFGTRFTAHQAIASWHRGTGWSAPSVEACAPAPMHPASAVLHYGQSIFEGLKAIRGPAGADDDAVNFVSRSRIRKRNCSTSQLRREPRDATYECVGLRWAR